MKGKKVHLITFDCFCQRDICLQDMDSAQVTFAFLLSCLELGRTTRYQEGTAETQVSTLSCLLLTVVSFSSWQCPCHLPGTRKVLPDWQPGKQCRDGAEIHTHPCPQQQKLRDVIWDWCWPTFSEKHYIPVCQRHLLVQCVSLQSWTRTERIKRAPLCVNLCQWTVYVKWITLLSLLLQWDRTTLRFILRCFKTVLKII